MPEVAAVVRRAYSDVRPDPWATQDARRLRGEFNQIDYGPALFLLQSHLETRLRIRSPICVSTLALRSKAFGSFASYATVHLDQSLRSHSDVQ